MIRILFLIFAMGLSFNAPALGYDPAGIYAGGGSVNQKVIQPVEKQAKNNYATGLRLGGYILAMFILPVIIFIVVRLIRMMGLRIK